MVERGPARLRSRCRDMRARRVRTCAPHERRQQDHGEEGEAVLCRKVAALVLVLEQLVHHLQESDTQWRLAIVILGDGAHGEAEGRAELSQGRAWHCLQQRGKGRQVGVAVRPRVAALQHGGQQGRRMPARELCGASAAACGR